MLKAGGDKGTAKRSSSLNWPRAGRRWRRAGRGSDTLEVATGEGTAERRTVSKLNPSNT
jgi:hypothetical protein